jgi:hypothetical protein
VEAVTVQSTQMAKPVSPYLVVDLEGELPCSLCKGKIALVSARDEIEFPKGTKVMWEKTNWVVNAKELGVADTEKLLYIVRKTAIVCRL